MSVFERRCQSESKEEFIGKSEFKESENLDNTLPDIKTVEKRTPQESESELTAPYVARGFKEQYSTKLDGEGNVIPAEWGEAGSRRPDAYDPKSNTVVEVKNYSVEKASGRNNLVHNIRKQTDGSIEQYGEDVNTIEVIDLRGHDVSIDDVDKLTKKLEEKCPEIGIDLRW